MTTNPQFDFSGSTYDPAQDRERLSTQLLAVRRFMFDHLDEWVTPEQLEAATGYRWASISARLRDLRKSKFGGFDVKHKRVAGGSYVYRLTL